MNNNVDVVVASAEQIVSLNDLLKEEGNGEKEESSMQGSQQEFSQWLTSSPLFIIVALSRVILAPMSQFGCVVAFAWTALGSS